MLRHAVLSAMMTWVLLRTLFSFDSPGALARTAGLYGLCALLALLLEMLAPADVGEPPVGATDAVVR